MSATTLSVGFIPLVDAAPLVLAQEMGFAAEEGITLDLRRAPSWSSLRDMLSFGKVEAAHMLSPVPIATALGLGGAGAPLSAVSVLSVNGNVIGISRALADRLREEGWITVAALGDADDGQALGCTHRLDGGEAKPL